MNSDINPSIGCTVKECKYNYEKEDYCTLDKIMVGQHETEASYEEDTDCNSFERR